MTKSRVASGHLVRIHRGVYAVGHRRLRREGVYLAAVLGAGGGAVLSHRDAAGLHSLRSASHRLVDVTVAKQRRPLDGVRIHRAALPPEDVTEVEGLPVTTVARTLVDLAGAVPADSLRKALNEAERAGTFDLRAIERVLERTRGRNGRGHAAMRAALEDLRAHDVEETRSRMEDRFRALVAAHGLPRPRTNVWVRGREVDAWWPAAGVAVELDSWQWHRTRRSFQGDREKGNALALHGVALLRFTWRDVTERPAQVAAQVAAALAERAAA